MKPQDPQRGSVSPRGEPSDERFDKFLDHVARMIAIAHVRGTKNGTEAGETSLPKKLRRERS